MSTHRMIGCSCAPNLPGYRRGVDTCSIYGGVYHLDTVGKVALGLFARESVLAVVYEN
jgi:hypothetical protein